jgi:hypothetical protein
MPEMSQHRGTVGPVIASDQRALRVGSAKLIVDGIDTTLVRKAEISLGPSRVQARALTQLLNLSREIYNGALQHRCDAWYMTRNTSHPASISRFLDAEYGRSTQRTPREIACGHTEAANRCRTRFSCRKCGHQEHADVNAAQVITARGQIAETSWRAAGCPVAKSPVPRNRRRQAGSQITGRHHAT